MNDDQITLAVKIAVREVFATLGVNVEDPEAIEDFRQNLRFGASLRRASERGFAAMLLTGATAVAAGVCSLIWMGLQIKLTGKVGP